MPNRNLKIVTPRGTVYQTTTKAGKVNAVLEWEPGFGNRYTGKFEKAQRFVDSEVLRFCSARVPFQTGMLQKSGILGTTVGSGEVSYIAPYATDQYYNTAESRPYDAHRGAKWFERGKATERHGAGNCYILPDYIPRL